MVCKGLSEAAHLPLDPETTAAPGAGTVGRPRPGSRHLLGPHPSGGPPQAPGPNSPAGLAPNNQGTESYDYPTQTLGTVKRHLRTIRQLSAGPRHEKRHFVRFGASEHFV